MISKSAGSAPAATPSPTRPGMARREPRGLLDHERGRPEQQQQRARRRPPGRHRVERESRGLQRVREVAREPAVVLARHHPVEPVRRPRAPPARAARSTISGAGEIEMRIQPQRDRAGANGAVGCLHAPSLAAPLAPRQVVKGQFPWVLPRSFAAGWPSVVGVAGILRCDHWPFAGPRDQCPTAVGLEVVVVGAERVELVEPRVFGFGPLDAGGRSRRTGCGCSRPRCRWVIATTTRPVARRSARGRGA